MSPLSFTHRLTVVRCCAQGVTHTDTELRVELEAGRLRASLVEPVMPPAAGLEEAAVAAHAFLWTALPATRRPNLRVEAGCVQQVSGRGPEDIASPPCFYLLATSGGQVLALAEELSTDLVSPWIRATHPREVRATLQIILDASAVLSLVMYCLETNSMASASWRPPPGLTISWARRAHYPPHRMPSVREHVGAAGAGGGPGGSLGLLGSAFPLLPEAWCRPLAALPLDGFGALEIAGERRSSLPTEALVMEELRPLSTGAGEIDWEVEYSLLSRDSGRAAGREPLRLRFDAAELLEAVRGAAGSPRPALVQDPILGDCHGLAPMLVTRMALGKLCKGAP